MSIYQEVFYTLRANQERLILVQTAPKAAEFDQFCSEVLQVLEEKLHETSH
jgi:hypothetical protein